MVFGYIWEFFVSWFKRIGRFLQRAGVKSWVSLAAGGYCVFRYMQHAIREIKISELKVLTESRVVQRAIKFGSQIFFRGNEGPWFRCNIDSFPSDTILDTISQNPGAKVTIVEDDDIFVLISIGISLTTLLALRFIDRRDQSMSKIKGKMEQPSVLLDDMVLSPSLKLDLRRSVQHLRDFNTESQLLRQFRARRGILLLGPPGVGKTSIARALAHEAGCSFVAIAATELMEVYAGMGPKRVRDIFQSARECEGPCILFIYQDALGVRQSNSAFGDLGNERNSTINQLLVEIDGFADEAQEGKILLIANANASNRRELIDPALLRSGRFDIKITIPLPDTEKRGLILYNQICKHDPTLVKAMPAQGQANQPPNFSPRGLDSDFSESGSEYGEDPRRRFILLAIEEVASRTQGYSPADMTNIVNEAIYGALAAGRSKVESQDLIQAYSRVKQGVEGTRESLDPRMFQRTAH